VVNVESTGFLGCDAVWSGRQVRPKNVAEEPADSIYPEHCGTFSSETLARMYEL